jgi:hypothetical protein
VLRTFSRGGDSRFPAFPLLCIASQSTAASLGQVRAVVEDKRPSVRMHWPNCYDERLIARYVGAVPNLECAHT